VKRAIVTAALLWAGLWPLAHYAIVQRYGINPWKLGAWAMYTVPTPPVLVGLFRQVPGGFLYVDHRKLSPALQEQVRKYEMQRHALGELARPEALADIALRELELPLITIVVQKAGLDLASAKTVVLKHEYVYERGRDGVRLVSDRPKLAPPEKQATGADIGVVPDESDTGSQAAP